MKLHRQLFAVVAGLAVLLFAGSADARIARNQDKVPPPAVAAPPAAAAPAAPAEGCCDAAPPCCYKPCISYCTKVCRRSCYDPCCKKVETVLMVKDPCCCCTIAVPVCLPACCTGEPCVNSRCGLFGRGIVEYTYCCGTSVRIVIGKCGDVKVTYIHS